MTIYGSIRAAKAKVLAKTKPVGLVIGSSTLVGHGYGAGWQEGGFVPLIEKALRDSHNPESPGQPRTTTASGSWSRVSQSGGAVSTSGMGHSNVAVSPGSSATWDVKDCTGVWVGLSQGQGVGNVTVSVDGSEPVSAGISNSGDLAFSGQWDSGVLPRGDHTFTFSTDGEVIVDFVHVYDGDNEDGIILVNDGWAGSTLDWHTSTNSANIALRPRLRMLNPDFIILAYGSNEESGKKSESSIRSTLGQMLDIIASETTSDPWIIMASQDRPGAEPDGWSRSFVSRPMIEAALDDPTRRVYTDCLEGFWGPDPTADIASGLLSSDGTHPAPAGHAALADRFNTEFAFGESEDSEMAYNKTSWVNGSDPAINAANLNKIESGIADAVAAASAASDAAGDATDAASAASQSVTALTTAVGNKVDKSTGTDPTVYAQSGGGTSVNVKYSASNVNNALVQRTSTGGVVVPQDPAADTHAASKKYVDTAVNGTLKIGTTATTAKAGDYAPAWADVTGKPTIPAATASGTRAQLDAGTDTTVRAFSAKDIKEFVDARIAALAQPKA